MVCTSTSSLPEVAGDAGLLVPVGDVPALQAAIQETLTESEKRAEREARGVEQARRFDWKISAREHVKVWEAVAR